jgi:GH35 family endo-1,4-beta-xylanase
MHLPKRVRARRPPERSFVAAAFSDQPSDPSSTSSAVNTACCILQRTLYPALCLAAAILPGAFAAETPIPPSSRMAGAPLATGKAKFLGNAYDEGSNKALNFDQYWNQVTPENSSKWGSVEATRDVMNWASLDAAYNFAKARGFPFKFHTLIWGNQQPAWIETLPPAQQLEEIEEWYAAVAARYPDMEMIDVVNEPINDPPNSAGNGGGNYINALGGSGATGWDWVIKSFQLARKYFPNSKLLINEYSITNNAARAATYVQIINLLKARGLVDGVGIQAHAFSTTVAASTTKTNLDTIAAPGVPIYISELDIDGPTDQIQLDDYKRIFPIFWEHPAVVGVTLWGYRPGLWRTAQGAYLITENGTERPALLWLKDYIASAPAGGPTIWVQPTAQSAALGGTAVLRVSATGGHSYQWYKDNVAIPGANSSTLTLNNVQPSDGGNYRVAIAGPGGTTTSETVALSTYQPGASQLINISTRALVGTDANVMIAGFVLQGSASKTVLIRASGPGLTQFNVPGVLVDPVLDVYSGSTVLASNDNWDDDAAKRDAIQQAALAVGAFGWNPGSKEAALLLTLNPGAYTAIVSGKNGSTGVSLVEVYEVDLTNGASRLINISTRSQVRTSSEVQIAGFVIRGSGPKKVVIRASGPALTKFNVPGVLADPALDVYSGNTVVASNDNWSTSVRPDFQRVGIDNWDIGSNDAAIVMTLNPGPYTAIVSGKNSGTGVALIEVFEIE